MDLIIPFNLEKKFLIELSKCADPVAFLGVAHILNVKLVDGDQPRDFEDIFTDVLEAFGSSSRSRKKELLKILKEANKDGSITKDTTTDTSTKEV